MDFVLAAYLSRLRLGLILGSLNQHFDWFLNSIWCNFMFILLNLHNKAFKTDSQRSAVLVLFGLCGYGAIVECRGSVAHHLSGR